MASGQTLSDNLLQLVRARMNDSSVQSWEMGIRAETLTEIDFPSISVFNVNYLAPTPPVTAAQLEEVLSIVRPLVNNRTNEQIIADTSSGDPASLGVAVLLGNLTNAPGADWPLAAQQQLDILLTGTPRTDSGAISHRMAIAQLWSDFIYMVPPFFAYYGAVTGNSTLMTEAYVQILLYRSALFDPDVSLWRHIYPNTTDIPGYITDPYYWSTGNGWAAAGMLRVLATIKNSAFASQFQSQMTDLEDWITEVLTGMSNHLPSSGVFFNYMDQRQAVTDDAPSFPDAASTALFASTVYRYILLSNPANYSGILTAAEAARSALYANNGQAHFDGNGWLMPVVDPAAFLNPGSMSPEAQSFVLQLQNNWQAWLQGAGGKNSTGSEGNNGSSGQTTAVLPASRKSSALSLSMGGMRDIALTMTGVMLVSFVLTAI